ncbi:hypothetical protein F7725_002688, partial [Dissostichus mawsoni]
MTVSSADAFTPPMWATPPSSFTSQLFTTRARLFPSLTMENFSPSCTSFSPLNHFTSYESLETEQLNSAFSPSTTSCSSSPLNQRTSAEGLDTSQIIFTLSVSVPSTLDRFFVKRAASSEAGGLEVPGVAGVHLGIVGVQSRTTSALFRPSLMTSYFLVFLTSCPSLNQRTSASSRETSHSSRAAASSSTDWSSSGRENSTAECTLTLSLASIFFPPRNQSTAMPSYDSSLSKVAVSPAVTVTSFRGAAARWSALRSRRT